MNDSLAIVAVNSMKATQDSLLLKTGQLLEAVHASHPPSLTDKLLPLAGVVIGIVLTAFAQGIVRQNDRRRALKREAGELREKILISLVCLKGQLHELAYLQVDLVYQQHLSEVDDTPELQKKALDEHYNDYKYISEYKSQAIRYASEITAHFHAYSRCTGKALKDEEQNALLKFVNDILHLPKRDYYPNSPKVDHGTVKAHVAECQQQYLDVTTPVHQLAHSLN